MICDESGAYGGKYLVTWDKETINLTANNNKTLKLKFDKKNKPDKFCTNFNDHFPFHLFSYVSYYKLE